MSRALTPSPTSRRRVSAGLIAALAIAAVVVAAALGVFAFALLRSDGDVATPATPSPAVTTSTSTPTPTLTPTPMTPAPPPAPASPVAQECPGSTTVLTIWAHPDDDIIFANPTIADAIAAGQCVRTVFATAGDAGKGNDYASARERGILRAYDAMRGSDSPWDAADITLNTGVHVHRFTPQGDSRLSVLFLRLPDGNIADGGFDATGHATLSKLYGGSLASLTPNDGGPAVTRDQLIASVRELAVAFTPESTLTHIPRGSAFAPGDHPDHSVVGSVVRDALSADAAVAPGIRYVLGYPSEKLPRNLDGAVLDSKVDIFRLYTQQDPVIRCADREACLATRKFGEWLRRSYVKTEAELQMG